MLDSPGFGRSPWRSVISSVLVHNAVRLGTLLRGLLVLDLFEKNVIFPQLVFQLFKLVFALFKLALYSVRVAQQRVTLVNSLHFYQTVSCALLLHNLLLDLLNLWHQLLFALWWRQITKIILWAVSGNCVLRNEKFREIRFPFMKSERNHQQEKKHKIQQKTAVDEFWSLSLLDTNIFEKMRVKYSETFLYWILGDQDIEV